MERSAFRVSVPPLRIVALVKRKIVIPTGAERSGGICFFEVRRPAAMSCYYTYALADSANSPTRCLVDRGIVIPTGAERSRGICVSKFDGQPQ
jgi:hypothetical protein